MTNSSMLILASAARAANSTTYLSQWSQRSQLQLVESSSQIDLADVLACVLSFLAAAISSGAGVGGGSLYVAILRAVAGASARTTAVLSRFMVTVTSLSNVLCTVFLRGAAGPEGEPLIDRDVVLASQPRLLLGASVGALCGAVLPEWLSTALSAAFPDAHHVQDVPRGDQAVAMRRVAEDGGDVDGIKEALLGWTEGRRR
ncbi:hypothetical protein C2845_PM08G27840 [Panicum miliaceum]|uniref:Uncharacterized protein n=1 Tax=Panicum miliaceum TaxID=4540 RepID=A0A3L6R4W7_PANMI|nr:hypothetical protein C2845_PM08G27840 [Panicum miliaceum]